MKYRIRIALCLLLIWCAAYPVTAQPEQPSLLTNTEWPSLDRIFKDVPGIRLLLDSSKRLMRTDPDSALHVFRMTLYQSRQIGYNYGIGSSLIALGMLYENKGQHEGSIKHVTEALTYCPKTEEGKQELALAYNTMATAYGSLGNLKKSVQYYYQTAKAIEQNKGSKVNIATVYNNLSSVLQDKELSLRYLDKADSITRLNDDKEMLGLTLLNKAIIYNRYKDWGNSKKCLDEALTLGRSTGQKLLQHRALMRLGNFYLFREKPDTALRYLLEAQKITIESKESALQRNASQYLIGLVYYKLKDFEKAEQYLLPALAEAERLKNNEVVTAIHNALSFNYKGKGNYRKAFEHHLAWTEAKDSIQNEAVVKNIHNMEAKYRLSEKEREITGNKLLIARQKQKITNKNAWIIISLSGIVVFLTLGIGYYRNYKNKQGLQQHQITLLEKEKEIDILKGIMKGEEKERSRLARELHDGIGGMLTTANLSLNRIKNGLPENGKEENLERVQRMIKDIASEVRKTAHNLMPDILIHHGLEEALLLYCSNIQTSEGLTVEVQTVGDLQSLEKSTELLLYRIAQELIQNVMKHAQARLVVLQIVQRDNQVSLSIEDDGQGFDTEEGNMGFGLQNLHYRVQALQGYLSIQSEKGKGTTVYVEFDLSKLSGVS